MKKILKDTSFICNIYNEEDSIREFLESLKRQIVLPGEIIIVDGGSSDSTFLHMEDFFTGWAGEKQSPIYIKSTGKHIEDTLKTVSVKLIKKQGAGISEGRNIAAGEASGAYISVSDAGCTLDPAWLREIRRNMEEYPKNVNGGMNYSLCSSFLQKLLALSIMPGLNEVDAKSLMPSSRNICFRKDQWKKVGGYPEDLDFGEDMKFDFDLKKQGYRLVFCPGAAVYWKMRRDLGGIFRQFFRYAKGDALGKMYPLRHITRFVAGATFLAIIITGILVSPWVFISLILLGSLYCYKPYYRLFIRWEGNEGCRPNGMGKIAAFLSLPLLLILIDSAKVLGYLYGLFNK